MKVAIIGAGPAGLVTCKTLLESATEDFPFDPIIFEQEGDLGGTFQYRSYENSDLVSSKQLTAFSDFRLPLDHPDHLSLPRYVQYLREYAHKFNVDSRINYNSRVVRIARDTSNPKGGHLVSYIKKNLSTNKWDTTPTVIHASHIAMCTGLHVVPHIPSIPGIENVLNRPPRVKADGTVVKPAVYHSSKYKKRGELSGKRVLILGTGETGLDLAYESAKGGAEEAVLCTRVGFLSIPKALNDFEVFGMPFKSKRPLPIDTLITNLAETAYVHPWIAESRIRWFISDFVLKRVLCFLTGTHAGCNQWVGELPPEKLGRAFVALNKSHKALPYINRPYRKRPAWMEKVARYIDPPEDMPPITDFTVDFAPFPESFDKDGRVIFPESTRKDAVRMRNRDIRPDTVIFATGYTQDFSLFDPEGKYPTASDADIRDVVRSGDETVAFIGFLRPGIGAIPPIAEMQSFFWVSLLKGQVQRPLSPPHYHLLVKKTARVRYAVDHGAYMSTLARDIGAAPGLWELFTEHGLHVLVCYCFGAAFTTFYRLVGPFRSAQAPDIVKTELWETVTRRGFWGNFLMGFIPMVFWIIVNALAYVIDLVWTAAGRPNLLGRK